MPPENLSEVREATNEQLARLPTGDGMALVMSIACSERLI
jgi:hypothetical protein